MTSPAGSPRTPSFKDLLSACFQDLTGQLTAEHESCLMREVDQRVQGLQQDLDDESSSRREAEHQAHGLKQELAKLRAENAQLRAGGKTLHEENVRLREQLELSQGSPPSLVPDSLPTSTSLATAPAQQSADDGPNDSCGSSSDYASDPPHIGASFPSVGVHVRPSRWARSQLSAQRIAEVGLGTERAARARPLSLRSMRERLSGIWSGASGETYELRVESELSLTCLILDGHGDDQVHFASDPDTGRVWWGRSHFFNLRDLNSKPGKVSWFAVDDPRKHCPCFVWSRLGRENTEQPWPE